MMKNNLSLTERMLPGIVALLLLFIYYCIRTTPVDMFGWFIKTVIVYAAWFFLLRIIIQTAIEQHFETKYLIPMGIGAFALVASFVIYGTTLEEILVQFLEVTVIFSIFITIYGAMRERIYRRL